MRELRASLLARKLDVDL
jgi:predicted glycosyl hydrolase (DUF1957 family)